MQSGEETHPESLTVVSSPFPLGVYAHVSDFLVQTGVVVVCEEESTACSWHHQKVCTVLSHRCLHQLTACEFNDAYFSL